MCIYCIYTSYTLLCAVVDSCMLRYQLQFINLNTVSFFINCDHQNYIVVMTDIERRSKDFSFPGSMLYR